MLNRFHSAVVEVADFDAGVGHYGTLLGRKPSLVGQSVGDDIESGRRSAWFRLANMNLEIRSSGAGSGSNADAKEGLHSIRLGAEGDDASALAGWLDDRSVASSGSVPGRLESADGASAWRWDRFPIDPTSSRGIGLEVVHAESGAPSADAPIEVDPKAAVRDLDHVVVFSQAAEATRSFYERGLGIRLALDKTFDERRVRLLFFRLGHVTIEIGCRLGAESKPEAIDRFGGLAWDVVDVESIRERLASEGCDVSDTRPGHKPGTRVCTVRDPTCGVPTLLIQPVSR